MTATGSNPYSTYGGGSDTGDLIDRFGTLTPPKPWLLRKMQRLTAANARNADDARILLAALDLDHIITDDEDGSNG